MHISYSLFSVYSTKTLILSLRYLNWTPQLSYFTVTSVQLFMSSSQHFLRWKTFKRPAFGSPTWITVSQQVCRSETQTLPLFLPARTGRGSGWWVAQTRRGKAWCLVPPAAEKTAAQETHIRSLRTSRRAWFAKSSFMVHHETAT